MRSPGEFAYAQARIEARQGDRLRDVDWKALESAQSLSRYLERARSTSLRRFLAHIDPSSSPHEIDRALRREAALYAIEIASFAPPRWRPAIEWIAALPLLPLLDGARDRELPRSATVGDEAAVSAESLIAAEAQRSIAAGLAALIRRDGACVGVGLRWLRRWRALSPQGERAAGDLQRLVGQAMRALAPGEVRREAVGPAFRRDLVQVLTLAFRSHVGSPAALVCHVGLVLADLERLRGGVVRRRLFAADEGRAA